MYDEFEITESEIGMSNSTNSHNLPPRPPSKLKARIWKAFKILAALIVVAAIGFGIYIASNLLKVSVNPFNFAQLKGESRGRVNIMMLGVGDPGHAGEALSDTDLLVSINTRSKQVAVISVPRDTRVSIPGYGYAKINQANSDGGVPLAKKVFEQTLGQPVDYYVKANFSGLKEVVDAVGGVDVNSPTALSDPEYPCDTNESRSCGFRLSAGPHHLDGTTALKYVRCRKGTCGDDFGRAARQQEVMQSIRDHASSAGTLANPVKLAQLAHAAGSNVQTDLSIGNVKRLVELTKGTAKSNIISVVFNLQPDGFLQTSGNGSDLVPKGGSFSAIHAFVDNIFKVGPIWVEHPTVTLENGTTTAGIAGKFGDKLNSDGYDINVTAITNAITRDHATSQIIDYSGGKDPHTLAYLESLLKVKATPPPTPLAYPPSDIVVILGGDYASTASGSSNNSSNGGSGTGASQ
jgi:LCP family protein required for cell wall assembly